MTQKGRRCLWDYFKWKNKQKIIYRALSQMEAVVLGNALTLTIIMQLTEIKTLQKCVRDFQQPMLRYGSGVCNRETHQPDGTT